MNIPTAHSNESLESFLRHIRSSAIPKRVDVAYLKSSGFTSGNDPELRHIFRLLNFLDDNDVPRELWSTYKEQGVKVLHKAVLECYKNLFEKFPDAQNRTDAELIVWFQPPITGNTKSSIERSIRTFRKLCKLAELETSAVTNSASEAFNKLKQSQLAPQLTIQLPVFKDQEDYERIFEALKKVFY